VLLGEQSISPRSLGLLESEDECTTILRNLENYTLDTSPPRRRGSSHNLRLQRLSSSRNLLLTPQVCEAVGRRGKGGRELKENKYINKEVKVKGKVIPITGLCGLEGG
jgi:hypothetical protein